MTNPASLYETVAVPAIFDAWASDLAGIATEGQSVLDVACGTGIVARRVLERIGPQAMIVGLDSNPNMLEVARELVPEDIDWELGDAAEIPYPDATFDLVLCQQGFQFFPNKRMAMAEMARVLKPGGMLTLSVWQAIENHPGFDALQTAARDILDRPDLAAKAFSFDDPDALIRLATEAGLVDATVRQESKTVRFDAIAELINRHVDAAAVLLGRIWPELSTDEMRRVMGAVTHDLEKLEDETGLLFPQGNNVLTAYAPSSAAQPESA